MKSLPLTALAAATLSAQPPFTLTVLHGGDNGTYAVSDIDGDGRKDIVIARRPRALQWLAYPSLETHPIAETGNIWMEIQSADMDGDGDPDVIAPNMASLKVEWYENPGPGDKNWSKPWALHAIGPWDGTFPHDFKAGDLDRDGKADAVLRGKGGRAFWIFARDAAGAWSSRKLDLAHGPGEGTALGDVDGDGDLDISDGLVWLETPPDPLRGDWKSHAFNTGYGCTLTRVAIADVDRDGRNDIVVSPSDTSLDYRLAWFSAADPRRGPWTGRTVMPAGRARWVHTLQVGDIDGDGHADVLTGSDHRGSKEMIVYYNSDRGRGEAWREQAWKTRYGVWQGVLADVSGDGLPDILSADDANDSQQELWINAGRPGSWLGRAGKAPQGGRRAWLWDAFGRRLDGTREAAAPAPAFRW